MIKAFKYKEVEIDVKTNWTKAGELYFGERDIRAILENSVKKSNYNRAGESTDVSFLVELFNMLKGENVKADVIRYRGLKYKGTKLTDMSAQKEIESKE